MRLIETRTERGSLVFFLVVRMRGGKKAWNRGYTDPSVNYAHAREGKKGLGNNSYYNIPSHGPRQEFKKKVLEFISSQYKLLPASSIGYVYYTLACLSIFMIIVTQSANHNQPLRGTCRSNSRARAGASTVNCQTLVSPPALAHNSSYRIWESD